MRVLVNTWVVRFQRREGISDLALLEAVERIEKGLIDADLGGGLLKVRVARPGRGRSAGYRMLLAYRAGWRVVFIFGFAKSDTDNLRTNVLDGLRAVSLGILAASDDEIENALIDGDLRELEYGEEN